MQIFTSVAMVTLTVRIVCFYCHNLLVNINVLVCCFLLNFQRVCVYIHFKNDYMLLCTVGGVWTTNIAVWIAQTTTSNSLSHTRKHLLVMLFCCNEAYYGFKALYQSLHVQRTKLFLPFKTYCVMHSILHGKCPEYLMNSWTPYNPLLPADCTPVFGQCVATLLALRIKFS